MGGTDDPSNLIELTIEEHAEAHKKLWEEHGKIEDKIAWKLLSGQMPVAEGIKEIQRNYMKNRVVSEETRKKMSDVTRKRLKEKGHPMLGKKFSDESRAKMSESHKGQIPYNKGIKMTEEEVEKNRLGQYKVSKYECPICGKLCRGKGNYNQHISKHENNHVLKGKPKSSK